MPALNVPFDDAEMAVVRTAAQDADQSLKDFVRDAALQRADRHKQQVAAAGIDLEAAPAGRRWTT